MTNQAWSNEDTPSAADKYPPTRLAIVTGYDRPGKHDATGAFIPEGLWWDELHGGSAPPLVYDDEYRRRPSLRRRRAEAEIREAGRLDHRLETLAVFGHGTRRSLFATGHSLAQLPALAEAIGDASEMIWGDLTVLLYACSTARGERGFADHLADLLAGRRNGRPVRVWGRTRAGHTTWCPYWELAGGPRGGVPIVEPGEPLWQRWRERLREESDWRLSWWTHGGIDAIREVI